jgi:hypothetical protein
MLKYEIPNKRYEQVSNLWALTDVCCKQTEVQQHIHTYRKTNAIDSMCGDGCMDCIHRPKSKVLKIKILKISF